MALFNRNKTSDTAEMSFVDHLEALRGHLFRSVLAIVIGGIIVAVYNDFFVRNVLMGPTHGNFPTYAWLCKVGHALGMGDTLCMKIMDVKMQSTSVSGQFSMYFTVLVIGGIIIAFPYIFWEFWRFIRPALTKKELSRTRGVIFWVSLLFFSGVFFGYFVIAPYTVNFFANFQLDENIQNQWTIESYIDTLIPLILGTGLAFQLPLVMFFLSKIGLVTPSFLRSVRKYAIVIILIVAGIITPPDVISQIIVTMPLILLYEVSIWLSARVVKEKAKAEALEWS
ncbi:twin-arginine translocase subunit TatC [Flavisolibacter tropicus]|uniref:Sec-independent protein translocase protein TatC n=1 Tax=Flavisolibacter tropicus TaxID=1492898 RepID=A0A172TY12_9BACT|nr:twin-arginine translocase subunit TatC [Flavisolibacter tropicus]ANE51663.1 preprotein translocase subunit TatC [Flavisolibacter tropicus]